jgi:hypothetical protein
MEPLTFGEHNRILLDKVAEQRERIGILEQALRLALSRETGDPDHDWTTCPQPSCALGRSALGMADAQSVGQPKE